MRLLLDTHAFLWAIKDFRKLSREGERLFREAEALYLSSVSAWEINSKYLQKKLELDDSPMHYIPKERAVHRIDSLPFSEEDAFQLAKLPHIHKDPFDRMLIAQAIQHNLTILTSDRAITQYPVATFW